MVVTVFREPLECCLRHGASWQIGNSVSSTSCQLFSYPETDAVINQIRLAATGGRDHMIRKLKPELLLAENIRTLLFRRHLNAGALAVWCGHGDSWISKIINGTRAPQWTDVGKIADFFGLTVAELLQHGISELAERRTGDRRAGTDRRAAQDRRQPVGSRLQPLQPTFPPRRVLDQDGGLAAKSRHTTAQGKPRQRPLDHGSHRHT